MGNKKTLKCTNNGLERYKKLMKSLFNAGTPSFADKRTLAWKQTAIES